MPKPRGYWTKERIFEDAKRFNTKTDWVKNSGDGPLQRAKDLGVYKIATSHMQSPKRIRQKKYSDEAIKADALKFNNPTDWWAKSMNFYGAALRRGKNFYKEATSHMILKMKPKGYWTIDLIKQRASNYESIKDWRLNDPESYSAARNLDSLGYKKVSKNLKRIVGGKVWFKENIFEEARKFSTIKEWKEKSKMSYQAAVSGGFTRSASKHMTPLGHAYKRCVYSIKLQKQNMVYIGLTYNFKQRVKEHMRTKRFEELTKLYGSKSIKAKQLTKYLDIKEAVNYETKLIDDMKKLGWKVLNKAMGGNLGGTPRKNITK